MIQTQNKVINSVLLSELQTFRRHFFAQDQLIQRKTYGTQDITIAHPKLAYLKTKNILFKINELWRLFCKEYSQSEAPIGRCPKLN